MKIPVSELEGRDELYIYQSRVALDKGTSHQLRTNSRIHMTKYNERAEKASENLMTFRINENNTKTHPAAKRNITGFAILKPTSLTGSFFRS